MTVSVLGRRITSTADRSNINFESATVVERVGSG